MTLDKVREVVREYQRWCKQWGFPPEAAVKANDAFNAYGVDGTVETGNTSEAGDTVLRHLSYMCVEILKMCDEGRTEKAMRWLGFVQGVFWAAGIRTLGELKDDNTPAPIVESATESESD